jgi:hypothetical protein
MFLFERLWYFDYGHNKIIPLTEAFIPPSKTKTPESWHRPGSGKSGMSVCGQAAFLMGGIQRRLRSTGISITVGLTRGSPFLTDPPKYSSSGNRA